jgi:hypothetical protein
VTGGELTAHEDLVCTVCFQSFCIKGADLTASFRTPYSVPTLLPQGMFMSESLLSDDFTPTRMCTTCERVAHKHCKSVQDNSPCLVCAFKQGGLLPPTCELCGLYGEAMLSIDMQGSAHFAHQSCVFSHIEFFEVLTYKPLVLKSSQLLQEHIGKLGIPVISSLCSRVFRPKASAKSAWDHSSHSSATCLGALLCFTSTVPSSTIQSRSHTQIRYRACKHRSD